jgi:uncharacterized CHY-type Zn-finger protein
MSSLVSDFFINPVLRQARRLSELSRSTFSGDVGDLGQRPDAAAVSDHADDSVDETMSTTSTSMSPPRPSTSSVRETILEADAATTPVAVDIPARDHLGFPLTPSKSRGIPEDDGMHMLRARIHQINACEAPPSDKARLIHEALLAGYRASMVGSHATVAGNDHEPASSLGQVWEPAASSGPLESLKFWQNQLGESAELEKFTLSESDKAPTYAPIRPAKGTSTHGATTPGTEGLSASQLAPLDASRPLGCQHYERNVKLQCFTCKKWYTCRFCHDAHEDHALIRKETRNMLCMLCATPQRASDICINCGETAASYYCNICKLWENRQDKPIYHCADCGICRRGRGLGKDFFHCKVSWPGIPDPFSADSLVEMPSMHHDIHRELAQVYRALDRL